MILSNESPVKTVIVSKFDEDDFYLKIWRPMVKIQLNIDPAVISFYDYSYNSQDFIHLWNYYRWDSPKKDESHVYSTNFYNGKLMLQIEEVNNYYSFNKNFVPFFIIVSLKIYILRNFIIIKKYYRKHYGQH